MGSTKKLDVLVLLADLHRQATLERSHYYVGKVVSLAIDEIGTLRAALKNLEARPTVRRKPPVQQLKFAIALVKRAAARSIPESMLPELYHITELIEQRSNI